MFECVDDPQAAHGLLDAAAGWLRGRGRDRPSVGPMDYSINYPCGLLIEGFDTPPRIMMNHNRRYYAGLLESWGLRKATDLYAWWFVDPQDLLAKWKTRAERLARRAASSIRPFRVDDFAAEVARCQEVYNAAMSRPVGLRQADRGRIPIPRQALHQIAVAEQVLLAEIDGRAVGVLHHAARHPRSDPPPERPADPLRLSLGPDHAVCAAAGTSRPRGWSCSTC